MPITMFKINFAFYTNIDKIQKKNVCQINSTTSSRYIVFFDIQNVFKIRIC